MREGGGARGEGIGSTKRGSRRSCEGERLSGGREGRVNDDEGEKHELGIPRGLPSVRPPLRQGTFLRGRRVWHAVSSGRRGEWVGGGDSTDSLPAATSRCGSQVHNKGSSGEDDGQGGRSPSRRVVVMASRTRLEANYGRRRLGYCVRKSSHGIASGHVEVDHIAVLHKTLHHISSRYAGC